MSFAKKLGNIYTKLNTSFEDINSALTENGYSKSTNFYTLGNKLRNVIPRGYNNIVFYMIERHEAEEIIIPSEFIGKIGSYVFHYYNKLKSVVISNGITSIESSAFANCYNLTSVTIPDSVTSIGQNVFYNCTKLDNITIPDSVTSIGEGAFYNTAHYLNKGRWSDGILYIGNHLIDCNANITTYRIRQGTRTIADSAFSNRITLTSLTIPDSVTSIGEDAFANCTNLDIYLNSIIPPTILSKSAIYSVATIHVPIGSGNTYKSATNWSSVADKIVEDIVVE